MRAITNAGKITAATTPVWLRQFQPERAAVRFVDEVHDSAKYSKDDSAQAKVDQPAGARVQAIGTKEDFEEGIFPLRLPDKRGRR